MKRILLLYYLFIAITGYSTNYYVSNSGSNSNNGLTAGTAFLTLQYASGKVGAGDSVIVLAGTYTGVYHTTSGTAIAPIVFHAHPGVLINKPNATTADGINLEGANYVVVEGFKVFGISRTGIRSVDNTGVVIRNNVCDSCGRWGILTGFSYNILIENNECSRSIAEHGIYHGNSADNPIIRNNKCWGNNSCGIHMNADASLGGDGIISNALVENNIIYNNGKGGGSGINCDGVQNSLIQNNLIYDSHASGISLYQIDAAEGAKNNVVVNNTVLQASDGRWALNIMGPSTGSIVFNNIFYNTHSFRGSMSIESAAIAGFKSDNNVVMDRMSVDGGNTVITLAAWKLAMQLDSNSVVSTPGAIFFDPFLNDYRLLGNSPARDFGVSAYYSIAAPTNDIIGISRPQGSKFDAGAYEYQSGVYVPQLQLQDNINPEDEIYLFDTNSRLIYSGKKKDLDTEQFSDGIYFLYNRRNGSSIKNLFLKGNQ